MNHHDFYIVGHRATGKTTAGQMIADRLDWVFVDLDARIASGEGRSCADIVSSDETRFRQLEREYLSRVRSEQPDGPRIVALGGGFRPVPTDGIVVWLERDGWRASAAEERSAIDSSVDFEAELDRMVRDREPRWERRAHLRYRIPRGRGPERAADDLSDLLSWLEAGRNDPLMDKTFLIPGSDAVERAFRDRRLLGCGGVELRSDLHGASALDRPSNEGGALLASLRTPDAAWIGEALAAGARVVDLDVRFLGEGIRALNESTRTPETVLVSTHPGAVDSRDLVRLDTSMQTLRERLEVSPQTYVCKYAPHCDDWRDVRRALEGAERLREAGHPVTFLPQGDRFAGIRPRLARDNATNYLAVGVGDERPTPLGLGDWIPHLHLSRPEHTEALIGGPVRHSQGARWHRAASERKGEPADYLKVELGRDRAEAELDDLLDLLADLGVRGISVTSPLKRKLAASDRVELADELEAANTLVLATNLSENDSADDDSPPRWRAFDTDSTGMTRALEGLEERGVEPGPVAIIGQGGVSPAVRRAIEPTDWEIALHASGREGWPSRAALPEDLSLVVNAAGNSDRVYDDPPHPTAWLDLHYRNVRPAPGDVEVHLNGDAFFDAQAERQRRLWRDADGYSLD